MSTLRRFYFSPCFTLFWHLIVGIPATAMLLSVVMSIQVNITAVPDSQHLSWLWETMMWATFSLALIGLAISLTIATICENTPQHTGLIFIMIIMIILMAILFGTPLDLLRQILHHTSEDGHRIIAISSAFAGIFTLARIYVHSKRPKT